MIHEPILRIAVAIKGIPHFFVLWIHLAEQQPPDSLSSPRERYFDCKPHFIAPVRQSAVFAPRLVKIRVLGQPLIALGKQRIRKSAQNNLAERQTLPQDSFHHPLWAEMIEFHSSTSSKTGPTSGPTSGQSVNSTIQYTARIGARAGQRITLIGWPQKISARNVPG